MLQTRLEKSGTNGAKTCTITVGRVRISVTSLNGSVSSVLYLFCFTKWPKSSLDSGARVLKSPPSPAPQPSKAFFAPPPAPRRRPRRGKRRPPRGGHDAGGSSEERRGHLNLH